MVLAVNCSWLNGLGAMAPQQDEAGFIECDTSIPPPRLLGDAHISIHTVSCASARGTLEGKGPSSQITDSK